VLRVSPPSLANIAQGYTGGLSGAVLPERKCVYPLLPPPPGEPATVGQAAPGLSWRWDPPSRLYGVETGLWWDDEAMIGPDSTGGERSRAYGYIESCFAGEPVPEAIPGTRYLIPGRHRSDIAVWCSRDLT